MISPSEHRDLRSLKALGETNRQDLPVFGVLVLFAILMASLRCNPDPERSRWSYLVLSYPGTAAMATQLRDLGITHLLLREIDFLYHTRSR